MSLAKYGSTIEEFVRRYRDDNDLSQSDLAHKLKVAPSYVGNVEQGRYKNVVSFLVQLRPHVEKTRRDILDDFITQSIRDSSNERLDTLEKRAKTRKKKRA